MTAFFPIVINTMDGVLAVDRTLREVGVAFRANKREAFLRIALPASLPYIFTGLRLGLARGLVGLAAPLHSLLRFDQHELLGLHRLVGVVVADLFGATGGIGYQILNAAQAFNTAEVFVGVAVLAGFGIFFTVVLKYVQHRLTPWSEVHGH